MEDLDAEAAAVYLSTVLGRPISVGYLRTLAHREGWRRHWANGRVRYAVADMDETAAYMARFDEVRRWRAARSQNRRRDISS